MLALIAALSVALGAQAGAAAAQSAGTQTVSGILSVIEGDPLGVGGPHRIKTYVVDERDGSRWTPVALNQAQLQQAGGLQALKHRRVTITGIPVGGAAAAQGEAPGEPAPLAVQSLTLEADGAVSPTGGVTDAATAATAVAVTGAMPVLNIMCKFADIADEPKDRAYFDGLVGETPPGLGHYWRENSYNAITLTGSASTGWLTLPSPRATYIGTDATRPDLGRLYTDCRQRASSAGHDPSAFAVLNLVFNGSLGCCSWGDWGVGTDGERVTWLAPTAYEHQASVAHEMGHAFGLHHSSFNGGDPYDSAWDVMSGFQFAGLTDPIFHNVGWHTIAYHKDLLGWMPAAQKYVVPAGSTSTITLERSAQPLTANYRMIQVAAGTGRFFTVEARRRAGYDASRDDAVIIHEVVPSRLGQTGAPEPAWVMGSDGGGGAKWTAGETFADAASGVSVRVDSATATGFVVTVRSGLKVLTVSRSGQGKVIGPGIACGTGAGTDCSEAYPPGTVVTLTATAFANPRIGEVWTFDHWEGARTGTTKSCTITMSAARAVKAVFVDWSE